MPEHETMSSPIWLFDLDNTLHDASRAVFGRLNGSMTAYIVEHLGLSHDEADALRRHYWQRYGATLLGLERHHGVRASHFLAQTHALPGLEAELSLPHVLWLQSLDHEILQQVARGHLTHLLQGIKELWGQSWHGQFVKPNVIQTYGLIRRHVAQTKTGLEHADMLSPGQGVVEPEVYLRDQAIAVRQEGQLRTAGRDVQVTKDLLVDGEFLVQLVLDVLS